MVMMMMTVIVHRGRQLPPYLWACDFGHSQLERCGVAPAIRQALRVELNQLKVARLKGIAAQRKDQKDTSDVDGRGRDFKVHRSGGATAAAINVDDKVLAVDWRRRAKKQRKKHRNDRLIHPSASQTICLWPCTPNHADSALTRAQACCLDSRDLCGRLEPHRHCGVARRDGLDDDVKLIGGNWLLADGARAARGLRGAKKKKKKKKEEEQGQAPSHKSVSQSVDEARTHAKKKKAKAKAKAKTKTTAAVASLSASSYRARRNRIRCVDVANVWSRRAARKRTKRQERRVVRALVRRRAWKGVKELGRVRAEAGAGLSVSQSVRGAGQTSGETGVSRGTNCGRNRSRNRSTNRAHLPCLASRMSGESWSPADTPTLIRFDSIPLHSIHPVQPKQQHLRLLLPLSLSLTRLATSVFTSPKIPMLQPSAAMLVVFRVVR